MSDTIIAYKGFNEDLTCRDFQYEIGREFDINDKDSIKVCEKGFHACTSPKAVLHYYPGNISRFCKVELSGNIAHADDYLDKDEKVCASHIKILEEVNIIDEMIKCGEISDELFSKNEEKAISNNFIGVIQSKRDWEEAKYNCHIGSRMLIWDGKYNVIWKCVHINNGYYFVADTIGKYPIDYINSTATSFYKTQLYRKILYPLGNELEDIFKEDLNNIDTDIIVDFNNIPDKHKITLLSVEEILGRITHADVYSTEIDLTAAFNFYKLIHALDASDTIMRNKLWTRTHTPTGIYGDMYYTSSGHAQNPTCTRDVNPLIWLR